MRPRGPQSSYRNPEEGGREEMHRSTRARTGAVFVLLLLAFGGCAKNTDQLAHWERVSRPDCQYGTVQVQDTVVVTGGDGKRWMLERMRLQCAAAPVDLTP